MNTEFMLEDDRTITRAMELVDYQYRCSTCGRWQRPRWAEPTLNAVIVGLHCGGNGHSERQVWVSRNELK